MKISKIALTLTSTLAVALALTSCSSTKKSNGSGTTTSSSDDASAHDVVLQPIYFDFDRYDIRADQEDKALAMAESLKNNPNTRVQVQGNTDDRGSVEYNMALGTKRAESLKRFLITAGVNSQNVSTVSYGKERPFAEGNNETSWAQNRRDEVVVLP